MGKHGKYIKHYRDEWEKLPSFKNWLSRAPVELTDSGKGEAFCKLCVAPLRAHKTDLVKHMKTKTHRDKELSLSKKQPKLASFGYSSTILHAGRKMYVSGACASTSTSTPTAEDGEGLADALILLGEEELELS